MSRRNHIKAYRAVCLALAMLVTAIVGRLEAADKAKIQDAILKAQRFILSQRLAGPHGAIAALAFVKSGGDKKTAAIQQVVQEILQKVQSGVYRPFQYHNYEAGVDLMLLEAIDGEIYRPQMEPMVAYLLSTQQPNGSWFYPNQIEPDCGDTSITQYSVMGLGAAARVGIEIPVEAWEKTARWHMTKQRDDGGFAYHPFDKRMPEPETRLSSPTMTAAGSSSLLIIRRMLFDDADMDAEVRPADSKRRFGVLERFVDERPGQKRVEPGVVTLRPERIDKALKESVRWMGTHYGDKHIKHERWFCYHNYSIERVAALLDVVKIGTHDWYEDGADELLLRQTGEGSWTDDSTSLASTAMGLMFLSKATTTFVTPKKRVNLVGGGLQAGGRGLPDQLGAVQVKEGVVSARKMVGAVDNLLIELERSADAKVEDVQAAVVEAVQLDRPEELIGQIVRLSKLAIDSRVEVRRTALWALGRSGDISAAPILIQGLVDVDSSVVREASLGLCILSRRPDGCGKPIDPLDDAQMGLKEDSTDEDRKVLLDDWKIESKKRWYDWYQKIRPYDERDDRTALKRTNK